MTKRVLIILITCTIWRVCPGQQNNMQLKGSVIDADDQSPMIGATVYLSNTTIGTTTSEKGNYILQNIPPGNYELVASYLGYKTFSIVVSGKDSGRAIKISLHRDVGKLQEITVSAKRQKDKYRENYFDLFKKCFLGTDANATKCKILNPDVLYYSYDAQSRTIIVGAAEPLVIMNEALGYWIHYDLQSFSYRFSDHHIVYFGYPRFENMRTTDRREKQTWENNRLIAYQQSKRYFMLTLKDRRLAAKGFEVNKLIRVNKDSMPPLPVYTHRKIDRMLDGLDSIPAISEPKDTMYPNQEPYDSIIGMETDSDYVKLKFNHSLRVLIPAPKDANSKPEPGLEVYVVNDAASPPAAKDSAVSSLPPPSDASVSIITMTKAETYIDPNGVLIDPLAVSVEGDWAYRQVADLLPFDYRPPE